jgi:deoxyhypusine synthase
MIPGGMRKAIRDMIEMKLIDVMVSTGATIFHDLFETRGYRHFLIPFSVRPGTPIHELKNTVVMVILV